MNILTKFIALLFGFIVISKTYTDYKKKQESLVMFLLWTIIWLTIITVAVYPIIIDEIGNFLSKTGSNVNNFIGVALVFLFFITYRLYIKSNRTEQKINKLVTQIGLKDLKRW